MKLWLKAVPTGLHPFLYTLSRQSPSIKRSDQTTTSLLSPSICTLAGVFFFPLSLCYTLQKGRKEARMDGWLCGMKRKDLKRENISVGTTKGCFPNDFLYQCVDMKYGLLIFARQLLPYLGILARNLHGSRKDQMHFPQEESFIQSRIKLWIGKKGTKKAIKIPLHPSPWRIRRKPLSSLPWYQKSCIPCWLSEPKLPGEHSAKTFSKIHDRLRWRRLLI